MRASAEARSGAVESTVCGAFRARVREQRGLPALEEGTRRLSYRELDERTDRLARALAARGVRRGERIAVLSENRAEYVEAFLAAAKLGAIVACLNWRLADPELAACARLVEPKLVLVSPRYAATLERIDCGTSVVLRFGEAYEAELAAAAGPAPQAGVQPEDGLLILYTSGTTGQPKGALVSHRALLARDTVQRLDRGMDGGDGFIAWSPLFHMGAADPVIGTLVRGAKVIVMDGFDAAVLARFVARERIGHLTVVPGVVDRVVEALKRARVRPAGVKAVGAMADLVAPRLIAELTTLLQAPYCNTFGSTETGPAPASKGLIAPGTAPQRLSKEQSSLCEVRLIDAQSRAVPDGEPGEVLLRGPTLFSGYWGAAEATAEVLREGWYRMGDVMVRNADGTLDFVDRRKYLIKSGGENIYPAEIERVLIASARIEEAVVVRKRDARWGEVPVAFVVARDVALTQDEVIAECRGKIAGYKLPKEVRFVSRRELPRNASGKIERAPLERLLAQEGAA